MSGQKPDEQVTTKPRPFWVDQPKHKVHVVEVDGDREVLIEHAFISLNAGNQNLLLEREKKVKRVTEKMTKGRFRPRLPKEDEGNRIFYSALIMGGGFRPNNLPVTVIDRSLIPVGAQPLYKQNGDGAWHAGFFPLTAEKMREFDIERMESAIERWFLCKGESVAVSTDMLDISFMFAKGGLMAVRLLIGDPESPAYRLKLLFRRPEQTRRSQFRDEFAYNVEHTKGEVGKLETIVNLGQGITFTDEHFAGISTEPDMKSDGSIVYYSDVVFTDNRPIEERMDQGEAPRRTTVEDLTAAGEGEETQETGGDLSFLHYTDDMRQRFLDSLHPMYKVEAAATAISAFKRADRESPTS